MAEDNGLHDANQNTQEDQAATSTSLGLEIEAAASSCTNGGPFDIDQQKNSKKLESSTKTVPFYKLFSFADSVDVALMIVGTIGAVGNGIGIPFTSVFFGEMIDSFGQNQNNKDIVHVVSKVAVKYVYLALGVGVAAFLQVSCWMVTGERQAARIRRLYLKSIMRQDIAFFDKEINTGEVVSLMSGDTVLIQDVMGEKVGKFIQLVSTFFGGFVIAFIKGWLLTLVLLSCIPLLVITGGAAAIITSKASSTAQNSYAKAANVVEQTIGSIRTVASFTGEKHAVIKYDKSLMDAYKSGIQEGLATGLGFGAVMCVAFCTYSLAVWYGAKLIVNKRYTGGEVINVIAAVLTGSVSLGQTSPCMNAFSACQAAGFKMFETINRRPDIDVYDIKGKILDDIRGDIELRDVYFSYPARPDEKIFNGFSLSIPNGMTAAIVGQSGSGKSTIISLIQRFYDPQSGQVLVDGINLKDFQLKWIREKIGLVSQEPMLFACSIKDNIAYGKDEATPEEIKVAVEIANAAKFIDKLPQKTLVYTCIHTHVDAHRNITSCRDRRIFILFSALCIHGSGSHSELLEDPEGAYSQLIRLQEVIKDSEQATMDLEKSDSMNKLSRQPSQRMPSLRSTSCRSFGSGTSSREIRVPFGLSTGFDVSDTALLEAGANYSQSVKNHPKVPLRRLAHLNKPEVLVLIAGAIAAALNGSILPTVGLLISEAIESFFKPPHQLKKDSQFWALMFVVLGIASFFAFSARTYLFSVAGCKLIKRVRSLCFEKVVRMEVSWFDESENSSGATGARLAADAATIRALVGDSLAQLVQDSASAIVGLVFAFTACWQLAFIVLALLPLIGLSRYVQIKFLQGFSADAKLLYEEAIQFANDAVGSIRTIASFCGEEKVMELYKRKCEGPMKTGIRQGLFCGIGFGLSSASIYLAYGCNFYTGAKLVEAGKAKFDDVFRVFLSLTMAALAISQSSGLVSDAAKAKVATASIFAILDRKSKIDPSDESGITLESVKGEIELSHISFKYPTRPDVQIFRDLNLNIPSGKTVALVGESGSGKSTVIALLQRFYDPESGHITLDGIEIQRLRLNWLRQQMGLVSQEPVLFNETIHANIAYGKEGNATEAEIVSASELANAHNFISGLQQGYDTIVGERGVQLSGGQKQRVAIARAMVRSPKILLLDEATSALDAESERVVQDALDRVTVNRTTVVVAHRLSTIKNADVIAVVKNGMIVEKGRHDTLINIEDGFYASLVALHHPKAS
ncbi:hypothetical protein RHSIM_Rhsim10G0047700 [Rhododendron simsii]|uniref:Uncharacterized protein n=1 Tax=Rhododendron simsii TaxID=118357 RepID=A0A834LD86_RHOSS|nr:hypothetical protein RHSIM_Rhsim10G0047700 [Rhododendron simsii]